jgi:L-ribulose-5-phosphate 3-epimerase
MRTLSRRQFLERSLVALGAGAMAGAGHAAPATGYRIFACDWTLQKTCSPESFDVAARIGLDGVQLDFGRVKESNARLPLFDEAHQDRILAASAEHKVQISSCALGVLNSIPYKSEPATEQWVLDSIGVMRRLRVPVTLLAFFAKGDLVNDPAGIAEVIRRLKKLAPRAEAAGVVYGIESWL